MTIVIPDWLAWLMVYAAGVVSGVVIVMMYAIQWSKRKRK